MGEENKREQPAKPANWRINLFRVLALVLVILVSIALLSMRDQIQRLAGLGYPGVFLAAMLASATVLVPAPGLFVVFTMGGILHPLGVALAAGTGAAIGEISGYMAGWSGQAVIERMDIYQRVKPQIMKYGPWAILVLGAIPNPTFDLVGIAAGALKMPFWKFFLAVWAAQIIKMLLFAFAGSFSIGWFSP